MDISAYAGIVKPLEVKFEDHVINITYHPNIYTLEFMDELNAAMKSPQGKDVAQVFTRLLASWDLLDNGQPIPLTTEGVVQVPMPILTAIEEAVADESFPSEEEKKGSSEPSVTQPSASMPLAETSPNGSDTSPLPSVSASQSST